MSEILAAESDADRLRKASASSREHPSLKNPTGRWGRFHLSAQISRISPIYRSDLGFELRFLGGYQPLIINGRTIWIVDAHAYGKRFIVHADELLSAFVELQRAIHEFAVSLITTP